MLFSNYKIGEIEVENRLVRSATTSYWSNQHGILRDPILEYYEKLAQGGAGLIIKGHSYINSAGKAHEGQSGLCSETHLPKMKELTTTVHKFNTPILAQLNHGGYAANADRATASCYKTKNWTARKLSLHEIQAIIKDFTNSANLALQAGFDGIQIHAAHGYLISQFLSDNVNKRDDKYGGSLKNRAKLLIEVYQAVRKEVGQHVTLGVKINCDDFAASGGLRVQDTITILKKLQHLGLDFAELSGGGPRQEGDIRKRRGRFEDNDILREVTFGKHANTIRNQVTDLPLAVVDGIRSVPTMNELLQDNIVDMISMSRPFIIEPDLPKKLNTGQQKSACINCSKCTSSKVFGKTMLRCQYKDPSPEMRK